jgi:hypothetical protein
MGTTLRNRFPQEEPQKADLVSEIIPMVQNAASSLRPQNGNHMS